MVEMRGIVTQYSACAQSKLNERPVSTPNRNPELNRNRGAVRANGHARKTRLVVAMVVVATLSITAILISPISPSSHRPEKAVPANPLGIIGDVSWTNMSPSISPGHRYLGALAYDPPTNTYVLFGGIEDSTWPYHNDTWSYDFGTNSWQNRSPAIHPDIILATAYAYDPVDEIILLFPSYEGYIGVNETWSYDASTNEWKGLEDTNAPPFRVYGSGTYDSESDKFVVFGGIDLSTYATVNETWSYDFTSNTWTNMTPAYSPPPVHFTTMVYDSESDRIIIFGGSTEFSTGDLFNGTWSYDLDSNTWTNMTPHSGPSERYGASAVYDPVSDLVLTFGGTGIRIGGGGPEMALFDDMWAYDYNSDTWSEVNQLTRPPARAGGPMAIDPWTRVVVLYGGIYTSDNETVMLGDTWSVQLGAPIPEFHTVVLPAVGVIAIVAALAGLRRRAPDRTLD